MKKEKFFSDAKKLSKAELSDVTAGLAEDKCPFDETCPNKYPGCYQPGFGECASALCMR
ncbi:MAG TPA: hypothetical protein VK469_20070 [Candidatus Kapabacteria bacterium]|nr:hypothetical protein [Candidatus Kapabacteria bacterium]